MKICQKNVHFEILEKNFKKLDFFLKKFSASGNDMLFLKSDTIVSAEMMRFGSMTTTL